MTTPRTFSITVTIYTDSYAQAAAFRDEIQSNLESVERPEDFFVGSVMEATKSQVSATSPLTKASSPL